MVAIYFSGTGNPKFVAQTFSGTMSCDCYSIEEDCSFSEMLVENDVIAVFYPIYGSCVPKIMRDFVDRYKADFAYKKLIIVCTQMMFSGDGA